MPYAAAGPHPFDSAIGNRALALLRIVVPHIAFREHGDGRDAGMRMDRHPADRPAIDVEQVEEDEGLETLAEIGGAHQADDVAVAAPAGNMNDRPVRCRRLVRLRCERG